MNEKTRLLCIDDESALVELIRDYFTRRDYAVLTAADGEEGLLLYREHKPDIILVDLRMPKVDGFAVLDTIAKESPNIPIIVISGQGRKADVIQALRLGAWNYHTKPVENLAILEHAVTQALEKAKLIKENKAYQKGLEYKLRTIIETFGGFIFTCDNDWRITFMNQPLINFIGRDVTGELCHDTIFNNMESICPGHSDDPAFEITSTHKEIYFPKDNRWYQAVHSPILDKDGIVTERQILLYDITERKQELLDLQEREDYLRKENIRLKTSLADRYKFGKIIGKSKAMLEVYEEIIHAAATDASVIIYGESGTGKELVAKSIHENSERGDKPLVYVNCGAIPDNLIESEFFGYKKGAFTGANQDKYGYLDTADGGTLFLDEVGEIPLNMQIKLLRAIEGKGFTPVGSNETKRPNIRIVAATNRDLKDAVRQGSIRQDFLYRIHIIPIHLPPLRERKEDLRFLIEHFLSKYDKEKIPPFTAAIRNALYQYDWPGNVRELQNTLNRYVALKKLDFFDLSLKSDIAADEDQADIDFDNGTLSIGELLDRYEKKVLTQALEKFSWHKSKVASALGIDRKTLFNKMKKYHLNP